MLPGQAALLLGLLSNQSAAQPALCGSNSSCNTAAPPTDTPHLKLLLVVGAQLLPHLAQPLGHALVVQLWVGGCRGEWKGGAGRGGAWLLSAAMWVGPGWCRAGVHSVNRPLCLPHSPCQAYP